MWKQNLLFVATLLTGAAGLTWLLFPPAVPPRGQGFDPQAVHDADFTGVVADIDGIFAQTWDTVHVKPAPEAPELAVVRRLSLALAGSVPALQEIRQYDTAAVQSYTTEERYQWWLTGTFQDRRYGDYMAERFARATVGVEDGPPFIYRRHRFTEWLTDQLMKNRSYDSLVRELIATDGFATNQPASNYIISTLDPTNKNTPDRIRLASRTCRAFLGIRLDCAQCHNHPFQPWKRADFEGLAAFFGQVDFGLSGLHEVPTMQYEIDDKRAEVKRVVQPSVPDHAELLPTKGNRRERLAGWITDKANPYFAPATVNRVWALLFGKPLIEPIDDIGTVILEPKANLKPPDPRLLQREVIDRLAKDFVDHHFDLQRLIRVIVALKVYRLDSASPEELTDLHDLYWAAFPMTRMRSDQVARSLLQACSLTTVNNESGLLTRLAFSDQQRKFIERYGDTGADEFEERPGTVTQQLLMMNGQLVHERTKEDFNNASSRIAKLSPDDSKAIEVAYLAVLTRRPTPEEEQHFEKRFASSDRTKAQALEDLYWTLLNSTEFAWNH